MNVQVLPFETGVHTGLMGSFDIFRFAGDPIIVYSEDYETGHPPRRPRLQEPGRPDPHPLPRHLHRLPDLDGRRTVAMTPRAR